MRKIVMVVSTIVLLPILSAPSCGAPKVCTPHAIRQDDQQPERFWVCNKDGTKEEQLTGPAIS